MEQPISHVIATCLQTVLRDEIWLDFGFTKRPKYGTLIQMIRPRWRVEIEKVVLKEMVIVLTAAHVIAGVISSKDIEQIADAYTTTSDVVRSLGYASRNEALIHLRNSIEEYSKLPPDQWPNTLVNHINPSNIPNEKIAARIMLGCAQFGTAAKNMINVLKQKRI